MVLCTSLYEVVVTVVELILRVVHDPRVGGATQNVADVDRVRFVRRLVTGSLLLNVRNNSVDGAYFRYSTAAVTS